MHNFRSGRRKITHTGTSVSQRQVDDGLVDFRLPSRLPSHLPSHLLELCTDSSLKMVSDHTAVRLKVRISDMPVQRNHTSMKTAAGKWSRVCEEAYASTFENGASNVRVSPDPEACQQIEISMVESAVVSQTNCGHYLIVQASRDIVIRQITPNS
ncbi:unnamed protein product [Prorocentrum cordatum]|uniref:Uncharacterized protein n=1 Tax=Prorocentrum cordatum TaxID=2364126 RepID=A0ABN9WXA0_9DINO|nr:unnamed protein product [Polarella glacialis]